MKRTSYLGHVDLATAAAKKKRFAPVAERNHQQLNDQTLKCVKLLDALSMSAQGEAEPEPDFATFLAEVERRAVAEGIFALYDFNLKVFHHSCILF